MQRREFLRVSAAAIGAGYLIDPADASLALQPPASAPAGGAHAAAGEPADAVFDSPPVLQNPATDGMTVLIAVKSITTAWVEFGPTTALGERADDSRHGLLPLSGRVHRIRIENLRPNTEYHYRVGAAPIDFKGAYKISRKEAVFTPVRTLRTLGGSGANASFAVINDTHENTTTLGGVATRLAVQKSQLTFWNGDIFNDVRSDDQIVANVMRPAGREYAAEAPLCFVSGNHDVRGIHARSLDRFVDVPRHRRYYTLRQGPVAFIVLDTGEDKPDDHKVYGGLNDFARYRDEQRVWLERAVQQEDVRSARFRVVVQHIPMWGGGSSEDSRNKWAAALAKAKVSAMICGHTHKHAWTPTDGDHAYPQLVGGGPAPESATVIEGRAEGAKLTLIARDLAGKELGNYEIRG